MPNEKLNILVLAGGESSEREVSLTSAASIVASLTRSGHMVRTIDTLDGHYLAVESGRLITAEKGSPLPLATLPAGTMPGISPALARQLGKVKRGEIDVVMIGLHGGAGENGTIQALLDLLGIPYTGSAMTASAIAMNKDISKRVMQSLDIPTAEWRRYDRSRRMSAEDIKAAVQGIDLALPLVVKPIDGGSTVGLSMVERPDQIPEAVGAALAVADGIIIEQYLKGREITIAVLDSRALPPVEIKPSHALYDYTCKYTKGKSQYICPANIEAAMVERLSSDAVRLYETIGCRGYARVDFIVAPDGRYICLELNTLPGMTELSLFPMAARAAGIEFDRLLEMLCRLAREGK